MALRRLLYGESPESVHIVLPQGEPVRMKIKATGLDGEQAWGCAEKFSGDDPDITAGKEIFATLRLNWEGSVQFFGGDGVGTVTLPGLGLEVGGPAINNGPRKMMEMVVAQEKELYSEYCCTNGIAQKYGCSFIPDNFTLARELWGMFKGEDAQRFFGGIVELCHSQCAPLLPNGELEVVLVEE